jgi:hypothetical protein
MIVRLYNLELVDGSFESYFTEPSTLAELKNNNNKKNCWILRFFVRLKEKYSQICVCNSL